MHLLDQCLDSVLLGFVEFALRTVLGTTHVVVVPLGSHLDNLLLVSMSHPSCSLATQGCFAELCWHF